MASGSEQAFREFWRVMRNTCALGNFIARFSGLLLSGLPDGIIADYLHAQRRPNRPIFW